jgi:hypothetical protein
MIGSILNDPVDRSGQDVLFASIPRYCHIERLGSDRCEGILNGSVIVQEKIDGACATVAMRPESGIVIASRKEVVSVGGIPDHGFRGLIEYVLNHDGINDLLKCHPNWILRGEWLVRHTVRYSKESYGKLYIFDVEETVNVEGKSHIRFLHVDQYKDALAERNILMVPEIARLESPTAEELRDIAVGLSALGDNGREGIVIKRYDYRGNKYGQVTWAKLLADEVNANDTVRPGQRQRWADYMESKFASLATEHFVGKIMDKIVDSNGSVSITDMPQILGRAWYELFTEELWNFVSKNHVKAFDFEVARKHVTRRVKDIALARFNGISLQQPVDGVE